MPPAITYTTPIHTISKPSTTLLKVSKTEALIHIDFANSFGNKLKLIAANNEGYIDKSSQRISREFGSESTQHAILSFVNTHLKFIKASAFNTMIAWKEKLSVGSKNVTLNKTYKSMESKISEIIKDGYFLMLSVQLIAPLQHCTLFLSFLPHLLWQSTLCDVTTPAQFTFPIIQKLSIHLTNYQLLQLVSRCEFSRAILQVIRTHAQLSYHIHTSKTSRVSCNVSMYFSQFPARNTHHRKSYPRHQKLSLGSLRIITDTPTSPE